MSAWKRGWGNKPSQDFPGFFNTSPELINWKYGHEKGPQPICANAGVLALREEIDQKKPRKLYGRLIR